MVTGHHRAASAGDVTPSASDGRCLSGDTLNAATESVIISRTHARTAPCVDIMKHARAALMFEARSIPIV